MYEISVFVVEINFQSEIVSILGLGFSISSMHSDSERCKEEILTIEIVSEILGEMVGEMLDDSSENSLADSIDNFVRFVDFSSDRAADRFFDTFFGFGVLKSE